MTETTKPVLPTEPLPGPAPYVPIEPGPGWPAKTATGPRDAPTMLRDRIKSGIGGLDLCADLRAAAMEMERDKAELARLRTMIPPHPGLWFHETDGSVRAPTTGDT